MLAVALVTHGPTGVQYDNTSTIRAIHGSTNLSHVNLGSAGNEPDRRCEASSDDASAQCVRARA